MIQVVHVLIEHVNYGIHYHQLIVLIIKDQILVVMLIVYVKIYKLKHVKQFHHLQVHNIVII
jgi:hypothetical protein